MKKSWKLINLDCANCAAKIEEAVGKLPGVEHASVNFMLEKLTIEAQPDLFEEILASAEKICRKIEPDCVIQRR